VDVRFAKPVDEPIFALTIRTPDGRVVYDTTTRWMGVQTPRFAAGERCRVLFDIDVNLVDGSYDLGADVAASDLSHYYDRLERALSFWVKGTDGAQGIADLDARVTFAAAELVSAETAA
ncbi:MAG: Wzt carbohydrate-binding domain-containing protein, partial [Anaerolineales bacterium]|nr:Wzt carbohydrate-binding domain-containing protein [Anaerolineales bacterium]